MHWGSPQSLYLRGEETLLLNKVWERYLTTSERNSTRLANRVEHMMKGLYIFLTLGMGTAITVVVSLACSYWFFSSFMGGSGYQAIGAGIAGCAIQLFGYGFSASFLRIHTLVRWLLCFVPLALSMFCTYSALYGYLSAEKQQQTMVGKKQDLILGILEQSAKDKTIITEAAKQSLSVKYRNQAKNYLHSNEAARDKDEKLIEKLDEVSARTQGVTPLDGLVRVTGNSEVTTIAFCVWLAVLFDTLPVIAIAVITRRKAIYHEPVESLLGAQSTSNEHFSNVFAPVIMVETSESVSQAVQASEPEKSDLTTRVNDDSTQSYERITTEEPCSEVVPSFVHSPRIDVVSLPTRDVIVKSDEISQIPIQDDLSTVVKTIELSYNEVVLMMQSGTLKPNYKSVQEITGWSQWKAQDFFKNCQENGILEKEGRTFKLLNSAEQFEPMQAAVNA